MKQLKRIVTGGVMIVLFALAATCGCTTNRNGQIFLSTLEDWDRVANPPKGERWFLALFDPLVYVGYFVGMFTVGPVSDIVFLPYDLRLAREGTNIVVVDENMQPIPNASVRVDYHGACLSDRGMTDDMGIFRTGIKFDRIAYGWTNVEKSGFYPSSWFWRPTGGENSPLGNFNVQTTVLSRIVHPVDLIHREARFMGDSRDSWKGYEYGKWRTLADSGMGVRYDFVRGDWLPPFGKGEIADVLVTPIDGHDVMRLEFLGDGNGVVVFQDVPVSGVQMRQAPEFGYEKVYTTADPGKGRQTGLYFRIRGNMFGKICKDIRVDVNRGSGHFDKELNHWVYELPEENRCIRVSFEYYLNPSLGDRNLEQKKPYEYWHKRNGAEP